MLRPGHAQRRHPPAHAPIKTTTAMTGRSIAAKTSPGMVSAAMLRPYDAMLWPETTIMENMQTMGTVLMTVPAHFDGAHIRLDADVELRPGAALLVTILDPL
jgi:hypothetical protein